MLPSVKMAKFNAWLKKRLRLKAKSRKRDRKPAASIALSRTSITLPFHDAAKSSRLFQLPYELRNMILVEVFGGQTLHIERDLQKDTWF